MYFEKIFYLKLKSVIDMKLSFILLTVAIPLFTNLVLLEELQLIPLPSLQNAFQQQSCCFLFQTQCALEVAPSLLALCWFPLVTHQ